MKTVLRNVMFGGSAVLALGLGSTAFVLWPRVEDIPEELEPIDATVDPLDVVLPAQGPLPALALRELAGKRVLLTVEGRESFGGKEARKIKRALNRWEFPASAATYTIADAQGFSAMAGLVEERFVGPMRAESRRPIYVDYEGAVVEAFKLPKGHFGLVVLDERGELILRHSGDADPAKIDEVRVAIGAHEPDPGRPAPEFSVGPLTLESCRVRGCMFAFLHRPLARSEIPGIEGGRDIGMEETFVALADPSVRLMRLLLEDFEVAEHGISGVVVGTTTNLSVTGWETVDPATADGTEQAKELRVAFGLPAGEAALVVIDREGRIAFAETGVLPFHRLAVVADILDIEPKDDEDDE